MSIITYKVNLTTPSPYPCTDTRSYLQMLQSSKEELFDGRMGIYIAQRILIGQQEWFFPFIDVDSTDGENEDERIQSAIANVDLTYRTHVTRGKEIKAR
ncbi:hypothetical protein WDW89_09330 [Deltaproteobacteria bacterium TL4]